MYDWTPSVEPLKKTIFLNFVALKINKVFISTLLILTFTLIIVKPGYANSCENINEIVINSKLTINDVKLKDKKYVEQILHLAASLDQKIRSSEYVQCKNIFSLMEQIDKNNTDILKKITKIYAWFPISIFGDKAVSDAWLLVQHSQDLTLQHKVLFIMEHLMANNEANKEHYALLYDRVALNYIDLGIKQKYGTQFIVKRNKVIMLPYTGSIDDIEKRRKNFGMQPLHEYKETLKLMFTAN